MKIFLNSQNIANIENYANGSVEDLDIGNTMDFTPYNNRVQFIQNLVPKLKHNGTLQIKGLDILLFSKELLYGSGKKVSLADANSLLQLASFSHMNDMVTMFEQSGLKLVSKKYSQVYYHICVKRP